MPTVTLLQKVYGSFAPKAFEPVFSSLCKGLGVRLGVVGKTDRGWIKIEVSGEDEGVALRLLDKETGLAPTFIDKLKKFSFVRGEIFSSDQSEDELYVDIGVFSPQTCDAVIPLESLQAQLADGKKLSLPQLTELFCFCDNMPVSVKVVGDVDVEGKHVEAELSEAQLAQIARWIRSSLDRLMVLGTPLSKVKHAVRASKHARDIIRIEPLGLLEHAVLCKLGTDAMGLVPRLGSFLPDATLKSFSPRKIRGLVDSFM